MGWWNVYYWQVKIFIIQLNWWLILQYYSKIIFIFFRGPGETDKKSYDLIKGIKDYEEIITI